MIKPLPGYCLIEPIEDEGKTASGLYTPETAKDKPSKGRVIDVMEYYESEDKDQDGEVIDSCEDEEKRIWHKLIHKDQVVVYKKWTNQEVEHEGKTYLLVHFNELLAIIE